MKHLLDFLFPPKARVHLAAHLLGSDATPPPAPYVHDNIHALFSYKNTDIKPLIHSLKYDRNIKAARFFSTFIAEEIMEIQQEQEIIGSTHELVISAIPARKERVYSIGYDQCELILRELARINPTLQITPLLSRTKETEPQTKIQKRSDREQNICNVFAASKEARDKHIVIIDDITTTGSTLRDATRALMEAGAHKVDCIAIAH